MIVRIANTPRDYAWGSTTAIAELLGTAPSGGPEAEYWLGDHPASPAVVVDRPAVGRTLAEVTASLPGGRLPFLMKVLAAAEPLSLQAHPTPAQAVEGFTRENQEGIALDDPRRSYKDDRHKPELIYALSDPFIALSGFRPVVDTRSELAAIDDPCVLDLLDRLGGDGALADTVAWMLSGAPEIDRLVSALTNRAGVAHPDDPHGTWATVRRLAAHYPGDPGIAISTLMNTVVLRPGEALYLPAGNLHSYQEGLGIEVMAASDNVIRGGLTPKHVDVAELLSVLDARPLPAPRLEPHVTQPGFSVFRPDVPDFALTVVEGEALGDGVLIGGEGPSILLCLDGQVSVDGQQTVTRGDALYLSAGPYEVGGSGKVVVASVND
ncbi:mannose-6-phosphate isomerase type 1 [Microcella alkaliphila]|uniref:mannose-6-phosphate isomerase n=1 Tax=Microcella alkaliphila TaxID=279828 RepID=A0A4Q7TC97_9MICO|nr:mannose-6-phosphate isomerase, class I [Microcella alkaliphila]RZT58065.1 mannose-6-phosphate isomerase type 1 [Microcella alkaliphila]